MVAKRCEIKKHGPYYGDECPICKSKEFKLEDIVDCIILVIFSILIYLFMT